MPGGHEVVQEKLSEWTATRALINELSAGHPRDICWVCEVRLVAHRIPGVQVGACKQCWEADRD